MSIRPIPITRVTIADRFWSPRQKLMTDVTIPHMEKILKDEVEGAEKSHAVSNFRMAAGEEKGTFYGFVFQDSDVAKWLEAAAYALALRHDEALSRRVDDMTALIGRAQWEDGYLNTYFTVREPQGRWTNLKDCHELYCAGHMMEAAAALHEAAGKDELLGICRRLADHIIDRFGPGKEEGIPGHQEIEIGLMRLYHVTGETKYRDMALRFLDLRGQDPDWFIKHLPHPPAAKRDRYFDAVYHQADVPVREQTAARGHAVRQVYMLTAMAEAAAATGDRGLKDACGRLFDDITRRQMYVTGAVGSAARHEGFTTGFDLPGDRCYGETCASIAMVFFARRMLELSPLGRYADLMELELYNAILASMQLDGTRFFYVNPLTVDTSVAGKEAGYTHVLPQRPLWHACACCPPNLARLVTSLGQYLFSEDEETVYSHLLIGSRAKTRFGPITLETGYPYEGRARYFIGAAGTFTLAVHVPGHAKNAVITVSGESFTAEEKHGYRYIRRAWKEGDTVEISFDMPVRRLRADPRVRDCAGRTALAKGPFIYCFEQADNPSPVFSLILPKDAAVTLTDHLRGLPEDIPGLTMTGRAVKRPDSLYTEEDLPEEECRITAIPYYAWSNREKGDMTVWIREG